MEKRTCPYCESRELEVDEDEGSIRCRSCGRSLLPGDSVPPETVSASNGFANRARELRGAPGEVSSWPAAAAAFVASALYYGLLTALPASGFSALFLERGWVPYVITVISVWALFLLAAKYRRLRWERLALDRDLVWTNSDGRLRPGDAAEAMSALRGEATEFADSFLTRRLERALRHFQSRRHSVEVVDFLASESRTDEGRVDASYGLVRVFVWAVPTLGFIGTVIGIGAAVAGFSETLEAASSLDGMKESIGLVTGGLGVAFDTTLLALVMSILIMFPTSAAQRIEEAFLSDVDDYCAEFLVPRLLDDAPEVATAGDGVDSATIDALAKRLVAAMQSIESNER